MPYLLTWFPVVALLATATMISWRRTFRVLPFFFLYVLFASLVGLARYSAASWSRIAVFYVYWISELLGAVLVSLALYEVFLRRLFAGFSKVRVYRSLFPLAAAVVLLLTITSAAGAKDKGAAFMVASRAFDFARTAFLVFFIGLMVFMGRAWRRYDLAVALGFGIQAAAALLNAAVSSRMHVRGTWLDNVEILAYDLSCLIWLIAFAKSESQGTSWERDALRPEVLHQARAWETVLKNWLSPKKRVL